MNAYRAVVLASSVLLLGASIGFAQGHTMSFFVTSGGGGDGANLGGLAGADAHCQTLADTAGVGHRTWRAYLSTEAPGARAAISGGLLSAVMSIRYILGFRKDNPNVFNGLIQNWPHF